MAFATIANDRIHYEVTGSGEPLVLLMPQSSGPRGVATFIQTLEHSHTVIRYDQRGTGRSTPAPADITMESFADEVIGVLDCIGVESASLICHSTGCGFGTLIAATLPQRINKLVLLTPWTHADPHLHAMQTLRQNAVRVLDPQQYSRFNSSVLFPPRYRREHADGFATMARDAHGGNPEEFARRLDAILAFDARKHYPNINAPTLVISAADDQLMPDWFGAQAANAIADAHFTNLDFGGHMLPETRGDIITDDIIRFLSQATT